MRYLLLLAIRIYWVIPTKLHSKCIFKDSHIRAIEELHDNIVYIGLDNDFYTTYQEILKTTTLQEIVENGILAIMDK